MPWKETARAAAVMIRRRYQCECGYTFDWRHASADEPHPDCPACVARGQAAAAAPAYVPPLPAIGTTKGKAIDLAQQIAEEDYGLTDMNDNQRAGDIAFKPPAPIQTAEREALVREMIQAGVPEELPQVHQEKVANYWQGNAGGSAEHTIATTEVSRAASAKAKEIGADPVGILEAGQRSGNMPMRLNVMSASTEIPEALQAGQARTAALGKSLPQGGRP